MMRVDFSAWSPVVAVEQLELKQMRGDIRTSPLLGSRYEVTLQGLNSRPASSDPSCWAVFATLFGIGSWLSEPTQR
jgi:hypothetical protein